MISPNTIDFKKAVNELSQIDETGNIVVLVVVLFIFVLYCIMLMVVKRMDKSDLRKVCSKSLQIGTTKIMIVLITILILLITTAINNIDNLKFLQVHRSFSFKITSSINNH